jgi:predicted secreted protein
MKWRNSSQIAAGTTLLALVVALFVALVVIMPVGCTSTEVGPPTLADEDNGKTYAYRVGDTITVQLVGAPIFGNVWSAALSREDAALFEPVAEPVFVPDSPPEGAPDGIISDLGTYTFTFKAKAVGKANLKLVLLDTFNPGAEPGQTFTVTVIIK